MLNAKEARKLVLDFEAFRLEKEIQEIPIVIERIYRACKEGRTELIISKPSGIMRKTLTELGYCVKLDSGDGDSWLKVNW